MGYVWLMGNFYKEKSFKKLGHWKGYPKLTSGFKSVFGLYLTLSQFLAYYTNIHLSVFFNINLETALRPGLKPTQTGS